MLVLSRILRLKNRPLPAALRAIGALMLREMTGRYGRTPGGYLWAVLEPAGGILLLSIGFSFVFHSPPLGQDFLLFYATGFLPLSIYQSVAHSTMRALHFSRPLLRYPAITWLDAVLARFTLNALTQCFLATLILGTLILIGPAEAPPRLHLVVAGIVGAAALGLGIGVLNCYLILRFRAWEGIWNILNRPLFFISGVFYLYEDLPWQAQSWLYYNPLLHLGAWVRAGIYPPYEGGFGAPVLVALWVLIPLAFGLLLMLHNSRALIEKI